MDARESRQIKNILVSRSVKEGQLREYLTFVLGRLAGCMEPIEVVIENPVDVVNKSLFKETPLLSFPAKTKELSESDKQRNHTTID